MRNRESSLAVLAALLVVASSGAVAENDRGSSATQFWNQEYLRETPAVQPAPAARPVRATPRYRGPAEVARPVLYEHRSFERRAHPVVVYAPVAPARPVLPPSATVVAVFGDRLGKALASGLEDGGAGPVRVVDATSEDAGLAGKDFDALLASIKERLSKPDRLSIAVMLIGTNDRTTLVNGTETAEPGTPRWQSLYQGRIDALAAAFRTAHVPLIWVGLPAVRSEETSADFVRLNGLIRDRAAQDGVNYVDCWEAFLDDAGRYSPVGPDVEGDMVKLRKADGFSFTHAGARKLASFVASDINRLRPPPVVTGPEVAKISIEKPRDFDAALHIDVNAQIRREAGLPPEGEPAAALPSQSLLAPAPPLKPVAGPVLSLSDPPRAPGGQLATLSSMGAVNGPDVDPTAAKPGRADDFSWPKP